MFHRCATSGNFDSKRPRRRWVAILATLLVVCLTPSLAAAQSCIAGNPIGSFPFTPGIDNPFAPGNSRVTNADFNGVAGDALSFQAIPGGANSQIQLVRAANNATVIATVTFSTSATYTITAADIAQFPYQLRITNNSTVNQEYVIGCTRAAPAVPPTVTAISPTSGSTAGGTLVTITGTNFTGATAVTIGGVAAPISAVNATAITATTGAHGAGVANVVVTAPGGTGTGTGLFTYLAPPAAPTITAIDPVSGPTAGGTPVTITGTNFTDASSVTIGGAAATGVTVVNATTITATTGAHGAGVVDVSVTTPNGAGTGTGLFTYLAPPTAPTVTAVSPPRGVASGGTAVTITGTNFTGATEVTIGGIAATGLTVVSNTSITATTAAHAPGVVDVIVTTPNGSGTGAGLFTFVAPAPPTVTAISPASGSTAGGTPVTITGTTFVGATSVTIGDAAAAFTIVNATTIAATTGAHAAGVTDVVVTTPGGTGTGAGLFTYVAPSAAPTVTAIDPTSGSTAGGTAVTITGTNFTGATAVTIGGVAAPFTVVGATTITATTAANGAGVADVAVTTPNGTGTGTGLFTYIAPPAAPAITAISPSSGSAVGGTAVTITGANFTGATSVTIGGLAATGVTVVNDTSITATTAARAAGVVDVVVTTPNGSGTGVGLFTFVAAETTPTKAIEVVGGFLGWRNLLIASSEPDSNREIDRLMEAERPARGQASGVTRTPAPDRASFGAAAVGAPAFAAADMSAAFWARPNDGDIGPPRMRDRPSDTRNWQFSTSLSEIERHYADATVRREFEPGLNLGARERATRANPFDVWIEGTYASIGDRRVGSDLDGHFSLFSLGADYVVNPRLLLGLMAQFDSMSQRSDTDASEIEGDGWLVGPYATLRLADNVFWRVRAAWGQSSNDVSPFLTYTDHFDTERYLVSSRLTGNMSVGRWTFRPSASVFYMEDVAQSYVDGDGATVPEITSRLGQIEAGPEFSYRYEFNNLQIEPRVALRIATTFANEANAPGFGQIDGIFLGADGVRARAEIGVRAATRSGLSLDLSGAYDGIGSESFEAYSARLTLRMPLN